MNQNIGYLVVVEENNDSTCISQSQSLVKILRSELFVRPRDVQQSGRGHLQCSVEALYRNTFEQKVEMTKTRSIRKTITQLWKRKMVVLTSELILKETGMSCLKDVTELSLQSKKLTDISILCHCHYLEVLDLSENYIKDITPLSNLRKLTELKIYCNDITNASHLSGLTSLTYLDVSENNIWHLPNMDRLTQLKSLYANECGLEDISNLKDVISLEVLDVGDNNVRDLYSLGELSKLRELYVEDNEIEEIEVLTKLPALRILHAYNNRICCVTCLKDTKINILYLQNNYIEDLGELC